MAASKTRWSYSFSNLGPKKQIAGTTFYKVSVGSDVKWLSMEGIRMLEKARQANVKFKTVRKAVTHFTASGTKRRLKIMRGNIERELQDLMTAGMDGFQVSGKKKGILTMLEKAGLDGLMKEFSGLLEYMNEEQLRRFYNENKLLLQKFFEDSDPYKSATSTDADISAAGNSVKENAMKLREKMLRIITKDMTVSDINKAFAEGRIDVNIAKIMMDYRKGHL